mgnify:CR=1 FL=1
MSPLTKLKPHWFHILLAVAERDLHGTAIMEDVYERTERRLKLWPGKLYGALRDMEDAGLVREVDPPADAPTEGGKRRFYAITAQGRQALHEEAQRLAVLVRAAQAAVDGGA